jgi:hypothetical protein
LNRNGIVIDASEDDGQVLLDLQAEYDPSESRVLSELGLHRAGGAYRLPPLAPLPSAKNDFRSAPDAKPMQDRDIRNVEFLCIDTAREIMAEVAKVAPEIAAKAMAFIEQQWRGLLTESKRFTLSAMAARKMLRTATV